MAPARQDPSGGGGAGAHFAAARGGASSGGGGLSAKADEGNPVVVLLKEIGLQAYAPALLQTGFDDLETLLAIEDADMKDLGIPPYHAVRLRKRLQDLSRGASDGVAPDDDLEPDPNHPVVAFLTDAGLGQYGKVLLRSGFDDMESLLLVEDADLKELGVARGHAVKLRKRLREFETAALAQDEPMHYTTKYCHARPAPPTRPPPTPQATWSRRASAAVPVVPAASQQQPLQLQKQLVPSRISAVASCSMPSEQMKSAVEKSWEQVQAMGAFAVGELLYRHTFELAPEAIDLFPPSVRMKYREWTAEEGDEEQDISIWESAALRKLFGKVINAVGCTVAGLHDMGKLVPMLTKLGMRHINYGVSEPHWQILGRALDVTLQEILGEGYTQEVQNAWTMVYGFMSSIMIEGLRSAKEARAASEGRSAHETDDAASQCSSSALDAHRSVSEVCGASAASTAAAAAAAAAVGGQVGAAAAAEARGKGAEDPQTVQAH